MAAGTLTLTNNSDAVAGAGTAFLTDLAAGDFIVANVGGIAYTLPVKAIASDTALTIVSKFTGPTMSGLAWFIAKRDLQAMIPAALGVQSAEALRVLNNDKSNWQAVFSAAGDITVTMPDGTQFTGPSWQKIVTLLAQSDIEAIQPLADQVRADAQQVAADKVTATEAATTATGAATTAGDAATIATQAKADAAASQTAAAASEVAAKADADRAEAAASIIDTTAFLRKDGNLEGIEDPAAARESLNVYSQQEVDDAISNVTVDAYTKAQSDARYPAVARVTALEGRIGYALVSTTSNLALGARMVLNNPFGSSTPVIVTCEILHATLQKWISTPSASGSSVHGITTSYSEGEGIILRSGAGSFVANTAASLTSQELTSNYTTPSPIRVHVWKVTA